MACLKLGLKDDNSNMAAPFQPAHPKTVDTLLPKAVKEAAEDALVGPAVWVSDEHIHIPAGLLPPSVRATGHTQQPRIKGLG